MLPHLPVANSTMLLQRRRRSMVCHEKAVVPARGAAVNERGQQPFPRLAANGISMYNTHLRDIGEDLYETLERIGAPFSHRDRLVMSRQSPQSRLETTRLLPLTIPFGEALAGRIVPAIHSSRNTPRRMECQDNLRRPRLAMRPRYNNCDPFLPVFPPYAALQAGRAKRSRR